MPPLAAAHKLGVNVFTKLNESHPKNLLLQAQHLILTGVPIPGNVRAAVATDRRTRFRFSAAVRSSFVSVLPHSGQRAENTLNLGGRFRFMWDARMTPNERSSATALTGEAERKKDERMKGMP